MKTLLVLAMVSFCSQAFAQSKTTSQFSERCKNVFTLFFYNNTLKMLNQDDNEEFDELIKDIDKMKFIRVNKKENNLTQKDFDRLVHEYQQEQFEDLMTMRHQGMNVNVYIKENDGVTSGLVLLMNEQEDLAILDIKGTVPLNKIANLISKVKEMN